MNLLRAVKWYSRNTAKTEFYSQLFIVSTVEAETMSKILRKFNELHQFMNFLWEKFCWLRQYDGKCRNCPRVWFKGSGGMPG